MAGKTSKSVLRAHRCATVRTCGIGAGEKIGVIMHIAATSAIIRLVLRKLAADAATASTLLLTTLKAAAFGTVTQTLSGKIVVEAQADGVITKYQLPIGDAALQPQEVAAMLSGLLDLYDRIIATGLTAGVGANDTAIVSAMLAEIYPIREVKNNYSGLRL